MSRSRLQLESKFEIQIKVSSRKKYLVHLGILRCSNTPFVSLSEAKPAETAGIPAPSDHANPAAVETQERKTPDLNALDGLRLLQSLTKLPKWRQTCTLSNLIIS